MATHEYGRMWGSKALVAACVLAAAGGFQAVAAGGPRGAAKGASSGVVGAPVVERAASGASEAPRAGSPNGNTVTPKNSMSRRYKVGDLNRDGNVNTLDLMLFMSLMREGGAASAVADINRDGQINMIDLGMIIENFDDTRPPESPDGPVWSFTTSLVAGNKLEMIDDSNEFFLIQPTATKLWLPVSGGANPSLVTPDISLLPQPDGCDLVFTFNNTTDQWSALGKITIAGVRFDESITGHDFRFDGKPITMNADNTGIGVSGWFYPGGTYSPVNVIEDGDYKVGVSLIYPVLSYKHQVKIRSKAQFPSGGVAWFTEFTLNANDENKYSPEGDLAPGESRAYVVAIRAVKGARPWQATLEPYRDFFRAQYGSVKYARDPRPIQFNSMAVDGNHEPENPYGFAGGYNLRPDLFGFGRWVDRLIDRRERGFSRIMVSKPTGQFYVNRQNNIPTLFTSHWTEGSEYGHNLGDAVPQFNRVSQAGLNLGLWWGRSAQVMPDGWDTYRIENLDPNNPEHVQLAFRELDLTYQAGARTIGLDAFRRMQAWDAVQWLQMMQARTPGTRFITEPVCGDILHNYVPAFQVATRPLSEAALRVETRHFLADLLNPGHEIWGYTRIDRFTDYLGYVPTDEDWVREAERIASLGYVPAMSEPVDTTPGMVAVDSWNFDE